MRNKKVKLTVLALLVVTLFGTALALTGPVVGRSISDQTTLSKISMPVPTAEKGSDEVLLAWDCPGCPRP